MTGNEHLSEKAIKQLLSAESAGDLDGKHLETCIECQSKLESLAADDWWWNEGRQLYSSSAPLIEQQDSGSKTSKMFDPVAAEVEAVVEHFVPAIHPELLGQVDEFQVESLIGVGGMGVVFKGFDRELNRPVAIKFLSPKLAKSGLAKQRFSREAKSAAAICHDNIIPIFRINTNWVYPFFVMPYVAGSSLEQLILSDGAMEAGQLVQIASGLSAAHEQGLIHRDIKPSNILLENNFNRIVITDFGLVHDENDVRLTQAGVITGTPQFMSPEQAEGASLDAQTDLFSLGSVMYWMATGKAPFKGASQFELLNKIRESQPLKARALNANVPEKLEAIIDLLLQKDPAKRIGSAKELELLLRRYSAHLQNPLENRAPRIGSSTRSNTIKMCMLGLVAVCIAMAFYQFTSNRNQGSPGQLQKSNRRGMDRSQRESDRPQTDRRDSDRPQSDRRGMDRPQRESDRPQTDRRNSDRPQSDRRGMDRPQRESDRPQTDQSNEAEEQLVEAFIETNPFPGSNDDNDKEDLMEYRRVFGLIDRVADDVDSIETGPLTKLRLINEMKPDLATRVIRLWRTDTQKKYGRRDLFVVEPLLVSTQLQITEGNWAAAEAGLQRINAILKNNFAALELRNKVAAISVACAAQTDNSQSAELLNRTILELHATISQEFSNRLDRIRPSDQ